MSAYNTGLQVTFILVQVAFLALGGVLIGVGAWLQVEEEDVTAAVDSEDFLIGPYLIIAAGCCIVVVAIIGVLGALCDKKINRFLLIFYIVLALIVFVAQLVGAILAFVYREDLDNFVTEGLTRTLDRYGGPGSANASITQSWDFIQENRDCCGINSVEDWRNSTGDFDGALFPDSCCLVPMCNTFNATNDDDVRSEGCRDAVVDFLDEQLLIVAVLAITFIVGEIVVVLMAFCLVCCTEFE